MKIGFENGEMQLTQWETEGIQLSHAIIDYNALGTQKTKNETNCIRLHFGIKGDYDFNYSQLGTSYQLRGTHNNIMYSDGFEIEVFNKSKHIETFGINFSIEAFVRIAEHGNDPLKRLSEKVLSGQSAILSDHWKTNSLKIHQVISEIINCQYTEGLKDIFLRSKSLELLVLQATLYEGQNEKPFIHKSADKEKLFEAKRIVAEEMTSPPSITALAKRIGLNEYKLKKGFKELFNNTVFGYLHQNRMNVARQLLLDTDKTAQEIAYEIGYSSPQHFNKAFKKAFNTTPNRMRNNP